MSFLSFIVLSVGATNGVTKVLYDAKTHRMLGAGILGKNAGELISEAALAVDLTIELTIELGGKWMMLQ